MEHDAEKPLPMRKSLLTWLQNWGAGEDFCPASGSAAIENVSDPAVAGFERLHEERWRFTVLDMAPSSTRRRSETFMMFGCRPKRRNSNGN